MYAQISNENLVAILRNLMGTDTSKATAIAIYAQRMAHALHAFFSFY